MAFYTSKEARDLIDTIATKEFQTKAGGSFDNVEVDEFLDFIGDQVQLIAETLEQIEQEKVMATAARPAPAPQPAPRPAPSIGNVEEVLTLAVQFKNNIIAEAQSKADRLLQEAELQAKDRLGALTEEETQLKENIAALKKTAADYRANFEQLLQAQQAALDEIPELF